MLNKQQVIAAFDRDFLPHCGSIQEVEVAWNTNLEILAQNGDISEHAGKTWVFPKEDYEKKLKKD